MITVVLRVYEGKELLYSDQKGTVKNQNYLVKIDEFFFAQKFLRLMGALGYCKVEFIRCMNPKGTPVPEEDRARLEQVFTDFMNKTNPQKELTPLERENAELKQRNSEFLERLERLEKAAEKTPVPEKSELIAESGTTAEFDPLPPADNTPKVSKPKAPKKPKTK